MKLLKLIPLIALLWIAIPLHAQLTTSIQASINLNSSIEFTLMRNYNSNMFYYVRTQDTSFFALNTTTDTTAQRAFIPRHYQVSDMEVFGNYAYFCGRNTATDKGFVGVFHIPNFLTGTATYRICENFVTPADPISNTQYDITHVRRLSVYQGGQIPGYHVVAVCESFHNDCVLEIMNASPTSMSWTFNIGETSEPTETLYDVVATQNYVVTAGTNNSDEKQFSLRIYNKSSIFASSCYQTIYPFDGQGGEPSNSYVTPNREDYHFTALGHDSVAVLSTIQTTSALPTVRHGIMLALFDVSTLVNQEGGYALSAATLLRNDITGTADVSALRYDSQNRRIMGVVHYDTTTPQTFPLIPINPTTKAWIPQWNLSTSSSSVRIDKGAWTWYQSLDLDAANARYFAIGWNQIRKSNLILSRNQYGHVGCDAYIFRNISYIWRLGAKGYDKPLTILNNFGVITATYSPLHTDTMTLQQDCSL